MIAIFIEGRLGNQLFQFAFVHIAAKKANTSFFLNQTVERLYLSKYFELKPYTFKFFDDHLFSITGFKNISSFHLRGFFYQKISNFFTPKRLEENNLEFKGNSIEIKNKTCYQGYFQSFKYYKEYEKELTTLFKVKSELLKAYQEKYQANWKNRKIITVHIRRGDYLNLPHWNLGKPDLTLPSSYYHQLIAKYQPDNNVLFVFIGDDIDYIKKEFAHIPNKYISEDTEINDFLHLTHADVIVSSNSTFSWWGAFLNPKGHKIIHCPKYFLGIHIKQECPEGIYPPNWVQHEVLVDN